jgi:hypothetical protein
MPAHGRPPDKYAKRRRLELAARRLAARHTPAPETQPEPAQEPVKRVRNRAQTLRIRAARAILEVMDELRPVNPMIRRHDLWTHLQDAELLRGVADGLSMPAVVERLRPMRVVSAKSAETRLARLIRLYA